MKSKYFLDTNIFLRFIVKDSEKSFSECKKFFEKIEDGKLIIKTSNIVLSELVWTLNSYYKLSKLEIVEVIKLVVATRNLELIDSYDTSSAIDLYSKTNVKYIDALIASCPQLKDRKFLLISYDKDFDRLKIPRLEPKDID